MSDKAFIYHELVLDSCLSKGGKVTFNISAAKGKLSLSHLLVDDKMNATL